MPIYAVQVVRTAREAECFIDVPDPETARTAGHKIADDLFVDDFSESEYQVRVHPRPVDVTELENDETVWVGEKDAAGAVRGKWVPVQDQAAVEAQREEPVATPGQRDFFGGEVPVQ